MSVARSVNIRTRRDEFAAIPAVLHSEWIKMSSLRSTKAVVVLTAVIGFAVALGFATLATETLLVSEVFVYSTVLTALLASVMGILSFSSEVQHATLGLTLSAQQARWVLAACKTIAAGTLGVVLGIVGMAAGLAGAVLGGLEVGGASAIATTGAWALVFCALAAALGLGIGLVVPNSAAAVSGLLAWWFVLENLLIVFLPESAVRFLPYVAGFRILGVASDFDGNEALAFALTRVQGALVFGAYAVLALGVGTAMLYRRDAG